MLSTDKQTHKQTNQRYQKQNLLRQGGNEQLLRLNITKYSKTALQENTNE